MSSDVIMITITVVSSIRSLDHSPDLVVCYQLLQQGRPLQNLPLVKTKLLVEP